MIPSPKPTKTKIITSLFTSRMKCVNHTFAPESIKNDRQDKRNPQISDSPKKILEANVSQSCTDNPPNSYS